MRSRAAQYLNEIVSLTFMGLMILALVAGQAIATPQAEVPAVDAPAEPGLVIEIDFSFRQQGE